MLTILSVINFVYGNVSVLSYELEISLSDIVEMQVVKEEDNSRFTLLLLFLMLIIIKRQAHTLVTNEYNKEDYPFSFYFILRIFSCCCMELFWKHIYLLLDGIARE